MGFGLNAAPLVRGFGFLIKSSYVSAKKGKNPHDRSFMLKVSKFGRGSRPSREPSRVSQV